MQTLCSDGSVRIDASLVRFQWASRMDDSARSSWLRQKPRRSIRVSAHSIGLAFNSHKGD